MNTEIFVEGRKLDLLADLASLITFAIDDVKDFASRSTAFSKTIVIPGTANNNKIFGHIFDTGISNDYDPGQLNVGYNFNPAKSARCIITQDYLQTFKGTIRMLEITKDRGRIEYEVALNGELTGLSVSLSAGLLEDLDFSTYDTVFNEANIISSWDNPGGTGVYFPMIDYGTYSVAKHDWDIRTFRPALYAREYIQKMFDAAGFRFVCPLFDTPRFKKLIIPHNQKKLTRVGTDVSTNIQNEPWTYNIVSEPGDESPTNFDLLFLTSSSTDWVVNSSVQVTYVGTNQLSVTPKFSVNGSFNITSGADGVRMSLRYVHLGMEYILDSTDITTTPFTRTLESPSPITVSQNDFFYIHVETINPTIPVVYTLSTTLSSLNVSSVVPQTLNVNYGDPIQINKAIPKNIRQVDFLLSIVRLFNLYIYEDRFDERLIMISPFVDFYSPNSGNSVDWTYKLNS